MGISIDFYQLTDWLLILSEPDICSRDKEDEIYITSASVIELDSRKCSDNDSYDSGIYNASTNTGLTRGNYQDCVLLWNLSDEISFQIKFNLYTNVNIFWQDPIQREYWDLKICQDLSMTRNGP